MRFAYWEPPAQGSYSGKIHIAVQDGDSTGMLCGKRVTSAWTSQGAKPTRWLCMTCELRQLRMRRANVHEALMHENAGKVRDGDGVPAKFLDVRLEYLEGFRAGQRGKHQTFPFEGQDDTTPLYYERKGAWDAGVLDGRRARRKNGDR